MIAVTNLSKVVLLFACYFGLFRVSFSLDLRCYCNLPSCIQTGYMCRSSSGCFSTTGENRGCLETSSSSSIFICSGSRDPNSDESGSPPAPPVNQKQSGSSSAVNQRKSGSSAVNQKESGSSSAVNQIQSGSTSAVNQTEIKGQRSTATVPQPTTQMVVQCCYDDMCNYPKTAAIDNNNRMKVKLFLAASKNRLPAGDHRSGADQSQNMKKEEISSSSTPVPNCTTISSSSRGLEVNTAITLLLWYCAIVTTAMLLLTWWLLKMIQSRLSNMIHTLDGAEEIMMNHPKTMNHRRNRSFFKGTAGIKFQGLPPKDNIYVANFFEVDRRG